MSSIRLWFVLGIAIAIPSLTLAQSAPIAPPATDPAATLAAPAALPTQPPTAAAQPRPAAAARTTTRGRGPVADGELAPTIAVPYATGGGSTFYYSPQNTFSRYGVPLDKEMQELMKKEADLSNKTSELVGSLKGATAEKKAEIKTQLIAAVEEHFGVRQAQREHQLKRIEEEVKKLREAIEKRNTSKKEIIERRIAELTGEDTIGF